MSQWEDSFNERLLNAADYREFLGCFFHRKGEWRRPKALSFQEFAKRAGFASKSFMADVIAGRKRVTPRSFEKIVKSLKLNKKWAEYLKLLIAQEEESFQAGNRPQDICNRLNLVRTQLTQSHRSRRIANSSLLMETVLQPDFPELFAALGTVEKGATLSEILRRTRFTEEKAQRLIAELVDAKLAVYDDVSQKVKPIVATLERIDWRNQEVFRSDFFRSIEKAKRRFTKLASSQGALFMTQTFSVNSQKLHEFKKNLAELISDFAAESESVDGDAIAEVVIGFTSNV